MRAKTYRKNMRKNNSILQDDPTICYICGRSGATDEHHIFNNPYRDESDEDHMVIYLHRTCHRWLHLHPVSNLTMKRRGQTKWEETYGTREDFIARYGKNYLDEGETVEAWKEEHKQATSKSI